MYEVRHPAPIVACDTLIMLECLTASQFVLLIVHVYNARQVSSAKCRYTRCHTVCITQYPDIVLVELTSYPGAAASVGLTPIIMSILTEQYSTN